MDSSLQIRIEELVRSAERAAPRLRMYSQQQRKANDIVGAEETRRIAAELEARARAFREGPTSINRAPIRKVRERYAQKD